MVIIKIILSLSLNCLVRQTACKRFSDFIGTISKCVEFAPPRFRERSEFTRLGVCSSHKCRTTDSANLDMHRFRTANSKTINLIWNHFTKIGVWIEAAFIFQVENVSTTNAPDEAVVSNCRIELSSAHLRCAEPVTDGDPLPVSHCRARETLY